MTLPTLKADELVDSYINGNRKSVCLEILAGSGDLLHPAVMAALVTLKLKEITGAGGSGGQMANEFIRILAAQID